MAHPLRNPTGALRAGLALCGGLALLLAQPVQTRPARAQERPADPQRVIERFQQYLARKPFHATGFEEMVAAAVSVNGLAELVAAYEERTAGGEPTRAERIVLARLYARTDRLEEALALLDAVGESSPELHELRGVLLLRARRTEEAIAAFAAAAASGVDRRLLERVHAARGEALAAAGARDQAIAALRDLAALDPGDYHLRIEAAERMAGQGLFEAALVEYETAVVLAAEDAPRRCRALAAAGRLQESLDRGADALATYERACDLLARGHWLKRELQQRSLAIHRRAGTAAQHADELRGALEAEPQDLERAELLAAALVELRDLEGARAVLSQASERFPADLELARRLLDVLARLGDADTLVREYQRVLAAHPDELELYLELGQVLAADGRLEQARRQWARTLEGRLTDAGFCLRLAELHALFELYDEALGLVERALELEPREIGHYAELCTLHARAGRPEEIAGTLERAEAAAAGDAGRLEVLAALARAHRDLDRAQRALEAALALEPADPRLLRSLADLALEGGQLERAAELLRRVVTLAPDAGTRRDAGGRLVRLERRRVGLRDFAEREQARLDEDPGDPTARYLSALAALERRSERQAREHLAALVEARPDDELARALLAELLEETGADQEAIAQYQALMERRPASRARYLKEIARLHRAGRREDEAVACYEEVLALSPGNPAAFREVAAAHRKMRRFDEAAECLRQALRLAPEDGGARLELAAVYDELDQPEKAEREVLAATRDRDRDVRRRARGRLHARLVVEERIDGEIERLRGRVAANPYDDEASLALIDLFVRELEYELALELLADLLDVRPADVELRRQRAELYEEMERWSPALADYEELARLAEVDQEELLFRRAECLLRQGDREGAQKLLLRTADLRRVASLYQRNGLRDEALAAVERALALAPDDRGLLRRLRDLRRERGELDVALHVQRRLVALDGETFEHLKDLGRLHLAAGDREALFDCCARALVEAGPLVGPEGATLKEARSALRRARGRVTKRLDEVRRFLWELQLWDAYGEVTARALRADPTNSVLVEAGIAALSSDGRHAQALEALELVRAETLGKGVLPAGYEEQRWAQRLARRERGIYLASPELAARRSAELAADEEPLTTERIDELLELHLRQERTVELVALLERASAAFPEKEQYRAGLALALVWAGEDGRAAEVLRELLGPRPPMPRGREGSPLTKKYRGRVLKRLPDELHASLTDELLARHRRLAERCPYRGEWRPGSKPRADSVRLVLAGCLARLELREEARALLAAMEPVHPELVETAAFLALRYDELGLAEDAARLRAGVWEVVRAVGAEPLLRHERQWPEDVVAVVLHVIADLERAGEVARAWELRRRWEGPDAALALVKRTGARAEITAARRAAWSAALASAPEGVLPVELRDAGTLLGELAVQAEAWDEVRAVFAELRARAPEDEELIETAARLEEHAGNRDAALELYRDAADAARERVRASGQIPALRSERGIQAGAATEPYRLTPAPVPLAHRDPFDLYGELRQAGSFYSSRPKAADWVPWELYCELFRLHFEAGEYGSAAARLAEMKRANSNAISYVQHELGRALRQAGAGAEALTLHRLLYDQRPADYEVVAALGAALIEAGQVTEAQSVYRKFLRNVPRGQYGHDDIAAALAGLAPEEAAPAALPREGLEEAVAADPKNVRLRTALVEHLLDEGRRDWEKFELAAHHALAAEELAPHLEEVRRLAREALALAGREEQYAARLEAELRRTQDPGQRLLAGLWLARRAWEGGDEEGARAFLDAALRGARGVDHSAARFFLERGRLDEAQAQLEREIAGAAGTPGWQSQRLEEAAAHLQLARGDPLPLVELKWRESRQTSGGRLAEWVLDSIGPALEAAARRDALAAALEAAAAGGDGALGSLCALLAARLGGDPRAYEERLLEHALEHAGDRELGLVAVSRARERADWEAAELYLERLVERHPASSRREVATSAGALTEEQASAAERGSLRAARGDVAGALELWRATFADGPRGARLAAHLLAEHGLCAEARAAFDAWLVTSPRLERDDLLLRAAIEVAEGRWADALQSLDAARVLPAADGANESTLAILAEMERCHRELGTQEAHRKLLRALAAEDPADLGVAVRLVELTAELDGPGAIAELVAGWGETGQTDRSYRPALFMELSQRAAERGALEEALAYLDRADRCDSSEWRVRQRNQERARVLLRLGRVEEAADAERARSGDPDGASAWRAAADFLYRHGEHERALAALANVPEEDAEWWYVVDLRMRLLLALERRTEALETILARAASPAVEANAYGGRYLRQLARESDAVERVEERLAAAPDDTQALAQGAVLDYHLGRPARAAQRLARLLELEPAHRLAHGLHWRALEEAGRFAEALAALELWLDRLDRERARPGAQADPRLGSLRERRGVLAWRSAGVAAARAAWSDSLGRRFDAGIDHAYQTWNLLDAQRPLEAAWLYRYGDDEGYLGAMEWRRLVTGLSGAAVREVLEARFRTGAREEVLEELWQALRDPSRSSLGQAARDELLIALHRRAGSLPALEARLVEARAAHPELESLRLTHRALLRATGRHAELVEELASERGNSAPGADERLELARALHAAGRHAGAFSELAAARGARGFTPLGVGPTVAQLPGFRPASGAGSVRFSYASTPARRSGGGMTAAGTLPLSTVFAQAPPTPRAEPQELDEELFVALAWLAERPEAARLEEEHLARRRAEGERTPLWGQARAYAEHGAVAAAERMYLAHLVEHPDEEPRVRRALCELFDAAGDAPANAQRRDAHAAAWLAAWEAEGGELTAERLWARASFRARFELDLEALRRDLQRIAELDPQGLHSPGDAQQGWMRLALGEHAAALERFRAQREVDRWAGRLYRPAADLLHGLALAQAAVEGRAAALPALRLALAQQPESRFAAQTAELAGD